MGAIHGAVTGQTTETGLVTGAGIGCLAGAIAAIQLMDLGVDGQSLSKVIMPCVSFHFVLIICISQ